MTELDIPAPFGANSDRSNGRYHPFKWDSPYYAFETNI